MWKFCRRYKIFIYLSIFHILSQFKSQKICTGYEIKPIEIWILKHSTSLSENEIVTTESKKVGIKDVEMKEMGYWKENYSKRRKIREDWKLELIYQATWTKMYNVTQFNGVFYIKYINKTMSKILNYDGFKFSIYNL